jgi:predicted O-methyltransferase YrrM
VAMDEAIASYVRDFAEPEDEPLRAARARSEERDIPAVPAETGVVLRFLARLVRARHVVEVGSGGGYSGLWLLGGMEPKGSLTSIEIDPDNQALAQQAYAEAGWTTRVRSILGPALSVLPKLADATYDIVFLDAVKAEYPEYLEHARRLLRPGGLLLADNALWSGRVVAGSGADDEDTLGLREFNAAVAEDPAFSALILPVGDGLLTAVYEPEPA